MAKTMVESNKKEERKRKKRVIQADEFHYYAIVRDRATGIFTDWETFRTRTFGFPSAVWKVCQTFDEASSFVDEHTSKMYAPFGSRFVRSPGPKFDIATAAGTRLNVNSRVFSSKPRVISATNTSYNSRYRKVPGPQSKVSQAILLPYRPSVIWPERSVQHSLRGHGRKSLLPILPRRLESSSNDNLRPTDHTWPLLVIANSPPYTRVHISGVLKSFHKYNVAGVGRFYGFASPRNCTTGLVVPHCSPVLGLAHGKAEILALRCLLLEIQEMISMKWCTNPTSIYNGESRLVSFFMAEHLDLSTFSDADALLVFEVMAHVYEINRYYIKRGWGPLTLRHSDESGSIAGARTLALAGTKAYAESFHDRDGRSRF